MSRIVGFVPSHQSAPREGLVTGMLRRCVPDAGWSLEERSSHGATLGWTGRRSGGTWVGEGLIVAIDGLVYNADELGLPGSLPEVIAGLYRRHGFENTIQRLNGDFAIALHDPAAETLWLARDRFGLKPLYYAESGEGFLFASRPAALLASGQVSARPNRRFVALFAACHYRSFDNAPSESPYADVKQLPAAHILKVKRGNVQATRYWTLLPEPDLPHSPELLAEMYRDLLLDSVRRRLRATERPAFTLSGGMDSSSVLACAVRTTGQRQYAVSTVYQDRTFDESDEIRTILDAAVERWIPIDVSDPPVFDLVRKMVALHDEPIATATWLAHYVLCKEAAAGGFGALFGGLGGDELNAGEYEHFPYHFADLRATGQEERLRREVEMWALYHDHPVYRKNWSVMEEGLRRVVDLGEAGRCLPDRARLDRYADTLNPDFFPIREFQPEMDQPSTSYLKNRTYQDMMRETIPCCVRAEDRHTTAFGLENVLPFFDHRLVELMFQVPGTLKFREGVTKHLLREAMTGILPEATRTRVKKTGWNAPAHLWFSRSGREQLLDLVHSQRFRQRGIYDLQVINRLLDEHEAIVTSSAVKENHMMFLWQLVNLELWLESLDGQKS